MSYMCLRNVKQAHNVTHTRSEQLIHRCGYLLNVVGYPLPSLRCSHRCGSCLQPPCLLCSRRAATAGPQPWISYSLKTFFCSLYTGVFFSAHTSSLFTSGSCGHIQHFHGSGVPRLVAKIHWGSRWEEEKIVGSRGRSD